MADTIPQTNNCQTPTVAVRPFQRNTNETRTGFHFLTVQIHVHVTVKPIFSVNYKTLVHVHV